MAHTPSCPNAAEWPLVTSKILRHAALHHPEQTVVSVCVEDGSEAEHTYAEIYERCVRLALALRRLGCQPGDVVATCAWNTHRHLEAWHALMADGLVCHTLNPRLFVDQLAFIASDAGDSWLMIDVDLVSLAEALVPRVPSIQSVIVLTSRAHMPSKTTLPRVLCYEDLLSAVAAPDLRSFTWAATDENAPAALCYTSGTTGNPKGVCYSHRSQTLHSMAVCTPDALGLASQDVVLMVVPIFHANGWSIASAAPLAGSRLVLPGNRLDGASVYGLLERRRVTLTAAVPTVWMGLLTHLQSTPSLRLSSLQRVVIGGAAVPESMLRSFEEVYGVRVCHAYGLTETSPLMTLNNAKGAVPRTAAQKLMQGRAMFTVELRLVDDDGRELPWDGRTSGNLQTRGAGVIRRYFKNAGGVSFNGDWFDTGDVATIDAHGFVQICDRKKDIVKSGGEWISSVEVEGIAMALPSLAAAACIGIPDEKWGERPMLIAVARPEHQPPPTEAEVLDYLRPRLAKWWLPDRVVFVEALDMTATGKFDKKLMRQKYTPRAKL